MSMATGDEVRGSEPVMTSKALLLELYNDMKIVRPAIESLQREQLPNRIRNVEERHIAEDAAKSERGRLGSLSNKALAAVILFGQGLIALWVAVRTS